MREASKDKTRLEHIVQAIERIKRYTNGKRLNSKASIQIHNGN